MVLAYLTLWISSDCFKKSSLMNEYSTSCVSVLENKKSVILSSQLVETLSFSILLSLSLMSSASFFLRVLDVSSFGSLIS